MADGLPAVGTVARAGWVVLGDEGIEGSLLTNFQRAWKSIIGVVVLGGVTASCMGDGGGVANSTVDESVTTVADDSSANGSDRPSGEDQAASEDRVGSDRVAGSDGSDGNEEGSSVEPGSEPIDGEGPGTDSVAGDDDVSGAEGGSSVPPATEGPSGRPSTGSSPSTSGATSTVPLGGTTSTKPSGGTTPTSGGPSSSPSAQPTFPIRAAFFYPWFPNAWSQGGVRPYTNFTPDLGLYASDDAAIIRQQLSLAAGADIDAFIASWWGRGHHTDDAWPALLDATSASTNPSFRWAVYYEEEGQSDPSSATIAGDLRYLQQRFFDHPTYLHVDGKPVVFVWADPTDDASMARRWSNARSLYGDDFYLVLKVFSGYQQVAGLADSWHQYGPATAYDDQDSYSATVSPGFWLKGESVRLERDLDRFEADVEKMNQAPVDWQLITSWNEWGEGTSIEPAEEYGRTYLDVLAANRTGEGRPSTPTPSPTNAPPPSSGGAVRFAVGADLGATSATAASLEVMADLDPSFVLMLGDLGYSDTPTEAAWCEFVTDRLGSTPIQLIVGNHEDDDREDGFIRDFATCLPDRMASVGDYGVQYYFDVDDLVRVILIGADTEVGGVEYDYDADTAYYRWLEAAIDDARSNGIEWIIVGAHKVCVSSGTKPCETSPDLLNLLIDKRVDLVLHGHEHNYQRSAQLSCVAVGRFDSSCVADDGSDDSYRKGAGLVWVINGASGGGGLTDIDRSDPEFGYLAAWMGGNHPQGGRGVLSLSATEEQLDVAFIGSTTTYEDSFTIR